MTDRRRMAADTHHKLVVQQEQGGASAELDAQIAQARVDLRTVSVADYNKIAREQRTLTETIETAIGTIATALEEKERLAAQQDDLQINGVGWARVELSTKDARPLVLRTVTQRIEHGVLMPIQPLDWTGRILRPDGEFE